MDTWNPIIEVDPQVEKAVKELEEELLGEQNTVLITYTTGPIDAKEGMARNNGNVFIADDLPEFLKEQAL